MRIAFIIVILRSGLHATKNLNGSDAAQILRRKTSGSE
jgi:hypothetical protein